MDMKPRLFAFDGHISHARYPFSLLLSSGMFATFLVAYAISVIVAGLGIWCFVEALCLKEAGGSNQFGSDPLLRTRSRQVMV